MANFDSFLTLCSSVGPCTSIVCACVCTRVSFLFPQGRLCFTDRRCAGSPHRLQALPPALSLPHPAPREQHSSSFSSLPAQAQQWRPTTRGPAPQSEVPGGLRDSCQRLLNLPQPSTAPRDPHSGHLSPAGRSGADCSRPLPGHSQSLPLLHPCFPGGFVIYKRGLTASCPLPCLLPHTPFVYLGP